MNAAVTSRDDHYALFKVIGCFVVALAALTYYFVLKYRGDDPGSELLLLAGSAVGYMAPGIERSKPKQEQLPLTDTPTGPAVKTKEEGE